MGLMRFHGFLAILLPHRPAPPLRKNRGGGLARAICFFHPPVGWGQKGKTSLYPP